jgi:hypothetical protein
MEIKNIISKISSGKEEVKEYFLSLEISPEVVKSVVWTVDNGKTVVIKTGSVEEWDENQDNSLLRAVDKSITNACENVKPEPEKVIFGLLENWVKGSEVSVSKKKVLGELCSKLDLKPIGFVVTLEALVAYLKKEEGNPLSAIFIHLAESQIIISLVQLGQILGSHNVARSEDLAADVREGLARFGETDNLPTRMILFNGAVDFEDAKQQLVSFDWQKELSFLHFPKVETLEVAVPAKAVAIAGGAEAAKSMGFFITSEKKKEGIKKAVEKQKSDKTVEADVNKKKLETDKKDDDVNTTALIELGFIHDQDIAKVDIDAKKLDDKNLKQKNINLVPEKSEKKQDDETLQINLETDDVLKTTSTLKTGINLESSNKTEPSEKLSGLKNKFSTSSSFFMSLKTGFLNVVAKFKNLFTNLKKSNLVFTYSLVFFVLLLLGGFLFYWYVPKAEVEIYLQPKKLKKEILLTVNTKALQVNIEDDIIPGKIKEIEVEGEAAKQPTGKKVVGEPAKGTITVYNKTNLAKSFLSGTVLIGPDKLVFTLDKDVMVASRSAEVTEEGENVTYGKAVVSITASSIGSESNLTGNTQLSFKEYPSSLYSAAVDEGLSGGESQEVTVVSGEDREELRAKLEEELKNKASQQIKSQSLTEEKVLEKNLKMEVLEENFSHKVEEETDNLTLNLKTKFLFLTYKNTDLNQLILTKIKDDVPEKFNFDNDSTEIQISKADISDEKAELEAVIKAGFIPQVNEEEIKKNIKGRYPDVIQDYFKTLPNFSRADIVIKPKFPSKLNTLPRKTGNINLNIKIEDN